MNAELAVYFELFGLAEDENGEKDWAGIKVSLGQVPADKIPTYESLIAGVNKKKLLEWIGLDNYDADKDIRFITKEEYEANYDNGENGLCDDDYVEFDEEE